MMNESGSIQEFEELLERHNKAFHDRDLAALRELYVPDAEVPRLTITPVAIPPTSRRALRK